MIAYLDSSVIFRILLGQQNQLQGWKSFSKVVVSTLGFLECLRTLDRMRLLGQLAEAEVVELRKQTFRTFGTFEVIEMSPEVLHRATRPLPTVLGTLDALHLSTALGWQEEHQEILILATHDRAPGRAGRALGLNVEGIR